MIWPKWLRVAFRLSPFEIFINGSQWKKRGYKGRVEVWRRNKFISAHKTIKQALDTIPEE